MSKIDLFEKDGSIGERKLEIYEFDNLNVHNKYGKDLFEGYDELYAITYSSGINFMSQIFERFKKAEVIFGYPPILSKAHIRLTSLQLNVLKTILKSKDAINIGHLIKEGVVKFYTSNDIKSHEKLFLLKGYGKYRTILGSANMSSSSFNGLQREIIMFCDKPSVFELMMERYLFMRNNCSSSVDSEKLQKFIENDADPSSSVGNAPVIEEVERTGKAKEQTETVDNNEPEDFTFDINEENFANEKFDEYASSPKINNGIKRSFITPESAQKVQVKSDILSGQVSVNPSIDIDYNKGSIGIGNFVYNLNPSREEVKYCVDLVVRYFEGWKMADTYADEYRKSFWKLFVWYFSSPFIPHLRSLALENHRDINFKYPMFSLLYGKSNCGKTMFLKFVTRLITGKDAYILEGKNTTCSKLSKYKYNCKNLPLNIDEVSKGRWRSYSPLIKEDTFGLKNKINSYAPVVFVTNEVESITMDLRKRCITLNLDSTIDFPKTINNDEFIKILDSAFDRTALFSEFASRMFSQIDNLAMKIVNKEDTSGDNILHSASLVLKEIFEEHLNVLPEYVRELKLVGDYFNTFVMSKSALEAIDLGLRVEPELFTFNEKENLLVYKNPGISDKRLLENIKNEMPPSCNAKVSLGSLSMNLTEAKKYLKQLQKDESIAANPGVQCLQVVLKSELELFEIKDNILVYRSQDGSTSRLEEIKKLLPPDWNVIVTASKLVIELDKIEGLDISHVKRSSESRKGSFWGNLFNKFSE